MVNAPGKKEIYPIGMLRRRRAFVLRASKTRHDHIVQALTMGTTFGFEGKGWHEPQ